MTDELHPELAAIIERAERGATGMAIAIEDRRTLLRLLSESREAMEGLRAELNRRKGDPATRLHNICEGLSEQADESPFTREEWERIDAENVQLRAELSALRQQYADSNAMVAEMREGLSAHSKWLHLVAERLHKQQRDYSIANTCEEAADAIDALLSRTTEGRK